MISNGDDTALSFRRSGLTYNENDEPDNKQNANEKQACLANRSSADHVLANESGQGRDKTFGY